MTHTGYPDENAGGWAHPTELQCARLPAPTAGRTATRLCEPPLNRWSSTLTIGVGAPLVSRPSPSSANGKPSKRYVEEGFMPSRDRGRCDARGRSSTPPLRAPDSPHPPTVQRRRVAIDEWRSDPNERSQMTIGALTPIVPAEGHLTLRAGASSC